MSCWSISTPPLSPENSNRKVYSRYILSLVQVVVVIRVNHFNEKDILRLAGADAGKHFEGIFWKNKMNIVRIFCRCIYSKFEITDPINFEGRTPKTPLCIPHWRSRVMPPRTESFSRRLTRVHASEPAIKTYDSIVTGRGTRLNGRNPLETCGCAWFEFLF